MEAPPPSDCVDVCPLFRETAMTTEHDYRFACTLTHLFARSLDFSRARIIPQPSNEVYTWTMPLRVAER